MLLLQRLQFYYKSILLAMSNSTQRSGFSLLAMANQARVAVRVALSRGVFIVVLPTLLTITFAINVNVTLDLSPRKASMAKAMTIQSKVVGIAPHVAL